MPHESDASPKRLFAYPVPVPRGTMYRRLGIGPDATAVEVRDAASAYVNRLKAQGASKEKLAEANAMQLESLEQRAAYDAEHPPLALLRIEPPRSAFFQDRNQALAVLRRDLERLLVSQGADVYFPSDVTRTDFSSEFNYSPVLDLPRNWAERPKEH